MEKYINKYLNFCQNSAFTLFFNSFGLQGYFLTIRAAMGLIPDLYKWPMSRTSWRNYFFCNQSGKCQNIRVNEEKCVQFHLMGSQAIFPVFFIHWLQKVSWNLDHRWLEYEICRFEVERIKNEDKNSIKINISGTFSCIFLQPTLFSIVYIPDFCQFFQIKLEYFL